MTHGVSFEKTSDWEEEKNDISKMAKEKFPVLFYLPHTNTKNKTMNKRLHFWQKWLKESTREHQRSSRKPIKHTNPGWLLREGKETPCLCHPIPPFRISLEAAWNQLVRTTAISQPPGPKLLECAIEQQSLVNGKTTVIHALETERMPQVLGATIVSQDPEPRKTPSQLLWATVPWIQVLLWLPIGHVRSDTNTDTYSSDTPLWEK